MPGKSLFSISYDCSSEASSSWGSCPGVVLHLVLLVDRPDLVEDVPHYLGQRLRNLAWS